MVEILEVKMKERKRYIVKIEFEIKAESPEIACDEFESEIRQLVHDNEVEQHTEIRKRRK